MRTEIIYALTKRCINDMREEELLIATDEELEEAIKQVKKMKVSKTRLAVLEREVRARRKKGEEVINDNFADEWNRVVAMFK